MPVRSLNSAVFKWPDRDAVLAAARSRAAELRARHPDVLHVWCVGSYARGNWGVGSDLDLVVVVPHAVGDKAARRREYEIGPLPVPVDLWVRTPAEWAALAETSPNLWRHLDECKFDLLSPQHT